MLNVYRTAAVIHRADQNLWVNTQIEFDGPAVAQAFAELVALAQNRLNGAFRPANPKPSV